MLFVLPINSKRLSVHLEEDVIRVFKSIIFPKSLSSHNMFDKHVSFLMLNLIIKPLFPHIRNAN